MMQRSVGCCARIPLRARSPSAWKQNLSTTRPRPYLVIRTTRFIARKDDRIVCAGTVTTRERFINGQPTPVGYLSGLRLDQACRRRLSIIRGGYDLFHQRHLESGPSVYLTSIVADNQPARRLLERGLPGMPTYSFLDYFVTLVFPARRISNNPALARLRRQGFCVTRGREADLDQLAEFLNQSNSRYQFSPKVDRRLNICMGGLRPNHFRLSPARCRTRRLHGVVGSALDFGKRLFAATAGAWRGGDGFSNVCPVVPRIYQRLVFPWRKASCRISPPSQDSKRCFRC